MFFLKFALNSTEYTEIFYHILIGDVNITRKVRKKKSLPPIKKRKQYRLLQRDYGKSFQLLNLNNGNCIHMCVLVCLCIDKETEREKRKCRKQAK